MTNTKGRALTLREAIAKVGAMAAKSLLGKPVAEAIYSRIQSRAKELKTIPRLVVILVGEDPASQTYVKSKARRCELLGFQGETVTLPDTISEDRLIEQVTALNNDPTVHGILVQLPLPDGISKHRVAEAIDPKKDVDGLHTENAGLLAQGRPHLKPCTPAGIIEMLKFYDIPMSGTNAVVLGRSDIVGKPMAQLLLMENATVTICHSRTKNLEQVAAAADLLVVAIGRPKMVDASFVKPGANVIDVGIHRVDGKLVGDVDAESVSEKAGGLSPVPGGVGPLTIAMLMQNVLESASR